MDALELNIKKILKRLDVDRDGTLLIHEGENVLSHYSRSYLDIFLKMMPEGTVSIMGDCNFNQSIHSVEESPFLNNQERIVLSAGKMLQLMTLKDDCYFVNHPSLMMASIGHYSRFFSRPFELDFPYGPESLFNDLYDLNATILIIGKTHSIYEAKYSFASSQTVSICKNTCLQDQTLKKYLDYDINLEHLTKQIWESPLMLYEEMDGHRIYGISYRKMIDYLRLQNDIY
ncbi:MAG: AAC(3) family N-acetyltransferase [Erysipelothrix sp.]